VVWFYGRNAEGRSVWGAKRPKAELAAHLKARGEHYYMPRAQFIAELEHGDALKFTMVKRIG
jgi:hypothetical protein